MTFPAELDHLILAGPSLPDAVDYVERITGVRAARGGVHPTGTANYLLAFTVAGQRGPHYLEIIGPDPDVEQPGPVTTFGIDKLSGPKLATFAVHPADLDATVATSLAAGFDPGEVVASSRRTPDGGELRWRLTVRDQPAGDGLVPVLIDWDNTPHPGLSGLPTLELVAVRAVHPDPEAIRPLLEGLGVRLDLEQGPEAAILADVRGTDGRTVTLS